MLNLNYLKKLAILHLVFGYVFIVSGLIVNILQFLTLIFVWPFDQILFRRLNNYLGYSWWIYLITLVQWWSGSDFDIYISDEDFKMLGKENAITIMNHKYEVDWLMGWTLCQRLGILGGSKGFFKSTLKYVPIIGWSWWLTENIFVSRSWDKDSKDLVKHFKSIFNYPKDLYLNIVILCEGTRFTKEKHEASLEYAKLNGLPELKHHLLPRVKGFKLLANYAPVTHIYDLTLAIDDSKNGEKPSLKLINNGVPLKYHFYLRRIPLSEIPIDNEEKCAQYLYKLYTEKDAIFDSYVKNGDFSQLGLKKHYIPKNGYDLYLFIFWQILVLVPTCYLLIWYLIYGSWLIRISLVGLIVLVHFAIGRLMSETDVNKSSKFGLSPKKLSPKKQN